MKFLLHILKSTILLVSFFWSQAGFSKTNLVTEFELRVPQEYLEKYFSEYISNKMNGMLKTELELPDQRFVYQQIPINLSGIKINIEAETEVPSFVRERASYSLKVNIKKLDLFINSLSINGNFEEIINGIGGRFSFVGNCSSIHFVASENDIVIETDLKPQVKNNQIGLQADGASILNRPIAFVLSEGVCDGPIGLSSYLSKQMGLISRELLSNEDLINQHLTGLIQIMLNKFELDLDLNKFRLPQRKDIVFDLSQLEAQFSSGGDLLIDGHLMASFERIENNSYHSLKRLKVSNVAPQLKRPGLRLPAEFIEEFIRLYFKGNTWKIEFAANEFTPFSSVMHSRLAQFFLWPELMNFSKKEKFKWTFYSPVDVDIDFDPFKFNSQMSLWTRMEYPCNDLYCPFVNFSIPHQLTANWGVSAGNFEIEIKKMNLDLKAMWSQEYLNQGHVNRYIALKYIRNKVTQALHGKKIKFSLPKLQIAPEIKFRINSAEMNADNEYLLYFEHQK